MTKNLFSILTFCSLMIAMVIGCKKTEITTPPELATFTNQTNGAFFILGPGQSKKIPVGVTTVSDKARTISFTVTSPTGAVEGTHYTLASKSVTIPAGKTIDSIVVNGLFTPYNGTGRKDTLIFKLNQPPDVAPSDYNNTFSLLLRGPCFDGDVTISDIAGDYTKTFENGSYGPYTTSITAMTTLTTTTATAKLNNLYDLFGPVTINFDWTDPFNTKAEIPLQITNKEYAAGQPFYVRTKPGSSNKFSVCNQRLAFTLDVLVNIGGTLYYYDNGVVYTMGR